MDKPKYKLEDLLAQCDLDKPVLPVLKEWDELVPVGREIIGQNLIWMLGDVHGNFDHVLEAVKASGERPAAVIFLGDLECQVPFTQCVALIEAAGIECWAIPGNHDTDSAENYENLWGDPLFQSRNLHGRVVEIAGVRVAGLGGVFRGEIWYPQNGSEEPHLLNWDSFVEYRNVRRPTRLRVKANDVEKIGRDGPMRKHCSTIFYDDWLALHRQSADILVTHEAPACHPDGFGAITTLAQSLKVKFSFHGHHHDSVNYRSHDNQHGFAAHGVGFMGITDMFGGIVRPGEFDEARAYRNAKEQE